MFTRVVGVAAAFLPSRYWNSLERQVPVGASAVLSGIATFLTGGLLGAFGFLRYAARQASALNDLTLRIAAEQVAHPGAHGADVGSTTAVFGNVLAPFGFLFFTPLGWLSGYLAVTGAFRAIAAHVDDPVGDPVVTGIDLGARTAASAFARRRAERTRLALEGAEIPDRVVMGKTAGLPDADLVIVSSRRKDGWTSGLVVMMPDRWYRLGEPVERTVEGHLRTLYPLKGHNDLEVARRSVAYAPPERKVTVVEGSCEGSFEGGEGS